MFIELAEILRCPEGHDPDTPCVLVPEGMEGRDVRTGTIACPTCRKEYQIEDGAVHFGEGAAPPSAGAGSEPSPPDAAVIQSLLGIATPGGYLVLIGTAACLADQLADLVGDIHLVVVNPPPDVEPSSVVSVLRAPRGVPLKTSVARGAVLGDDYLKLPWPAEAARVLVRAARYVALARRLAVPTVRMLAVGDGIWVGEKT